MSHEIQANDVDLDAFDVILDVRPTTGVARIPDSVHAPIDELLASPDTFLTNRNHRALTVCDVGMRSRVAADRLTTMGYTVTSLAGGIDGWRSQGRTLVTEDGLTLDQIERYDRQMKLPEIGTTGQVQLLGATVAVVGAGGLGAPLIAYLAGAGVGALRIIDGDVVEISNLHRQPIFTSDQADWSKSAGAERFAKQLNPTIAVTHVDAMIDAANATELLDGCDLVVDATDRFEARYVINDTAMALGIPLVTGAVYRWEGQLMTSLPGGPCYRCVFPDPPSDDVALDCAITGVVGSVVGMVGTMQATEAIALLATGTSGLRGRLVLVDGRTATTTAVSISRREGCPACG